MKRAVNVSAGGIWHYESQQMGVVSRNHNRKFFCKYCIQYSTEERILKDHTDICLAINGGGGKRVSFQLKERIYLGLKIIISN
ncbi:hypothetical protein MAR_005607 [Mya arenaria]|uniref:Uncharacterized protein n=1 Tax=Mya arenaria TaxID=6604 RepID=A0ABY7EZZ8_MYAAR|nr:hypothetical protein MAR_005607 [Mya arenaria]